MFPGAFLLDGCARSNVYINIDFSLSVSLSVSLSLSLSLSSQHTKEADPCLHQRARRHSKYQFTGAVG